MAITISGNGITSANIADGTITTDDINASDVTNLKSGRKNLIINGGMQVAQRGTSFASAGNGAYTLDRFVHTAVNDAVVTISQTADAPTASEAGVDFLNCLHVDVTTADTSIATGQLSVIQQIVEYNNMVHLGFGNSGSRKITLSFWVKATKTGTYCASIKSYDHTRSYTSEYTVSASDTWEKKTITFPVDTSGTWGTNHLNVQFILASGTDYHITNETWTATTNNYSPATSNQVNALDSTANNFKVTGVQLELGDTATDFEHRSYGEELALCQRYYHRIDRANYGTNTVLTGINSAAHNIFMVTIPASMRVAPTITKTGTNFTVYSTNSTAVVGTGNPTFSPGAFGFLGGRFLFSKTGDIGHGCWLDIDNADTYFEFDSEL